MPIEYEFEKVELAPFWKPVNKGESIEGIVSDVREITGLFGESNICTIGEWTVGISANLIPLLKLEGEYIKLTFEETIPLEKGKILKVFNIQKRKRKVVTPPKS